MASVNKIIIVGRLGQDPEVKHFDGGTLTIFSVATSEQWKDKSGERKEQTTWHTVKVFGKLAEISAKYLGKGREVFIEGRLQNEKFEKDGVTKYYTNILASNIQFLGSQKDHNVDTEVGTTSDAPAVQPSNYGPNVKNYAPGADNPPTPSADGF